MGEPATKHRVVVVTGAARGIGRAIAERFVADGHHVLLADIDHEVHRVARQIATANGMSVGIVADVADTAGAQSVVSLTLEHFARLDVLVNNAAVHEANGPLTAVEPEAWDRV